jgi:hypothetical protein
LELHAGTHHRTDLAQREGSEMVSFRASDSFTTVMLCTSIQLNRCTGPHCLFATILKRGINERGMNFIPTSGAVIDTNSRLFPSPSDSEDPILFQVSPGAAL